MNRITNASFYSRIDIWLALSIVGSLAWLWHLAVSLRSEEPVGSGIAVFMGFSMAFFYVYGLIPCKYTLRDDHLEIQLGRTRKSIPYREIKKLSRETNFTSAPALSLRRVRIDSSNGVQYVSPRQRERFIAELQRQVDLTRA